MNYSKKAKSYEDLGNYVMHKDGYTETNEWGCHELTAYFYEVVLLCKQILSKKGLEHANHYTIKKSLKKIDKNLAAAYKNLLEASREIRYESLNISKSSRQEFINNYKQALKIINKLLADKKT